MNKVICTCGKELKIMAYNTFEIISTILHVEPCPDCLKKEYDDGFHEGYDRGCEDTEELKIK